jgi:predicted aldo/keto reductase-like oxidoreductase
MRCRILGQTGLRVSVLGFGGIPIRGVSEREATAVVNRALDLGVNFIHTSITYGDSAFKIGSVMKERRNDCYLAVKVGGHTRADAEARLTESLDALNTDHVEIAELPVNASAFSRVMGPGGAYEAFAEAKEEGVIDFIGITSHDVDFLVDAVTTEAFSNLITPFNYVEDTAAKRLIPLSAERDLGVIAMKTLGRGGLPDPGTALRYVLNHDVDTAIVGMKAISEVEANVATVNDLQPLSVAEEERLREIGQKIREAGCLSSSGAVLQSPRLV